MHLVYIIYGGRTGRVSTSKGGQRVLVMLYGYSMDRSPQTRLVFSSSQLDQSPDHTDGQSSDSNHTSTVVWRRRASVTRLSGVRWRIRLSGVDGRIVPRGQV